MNKRFHITMLLFSAIGFLTLSLSHIFRGYLSDFALGFCEGLSGILILTWGLYMCYCFAKKKNPFKI